MQNAKMFKIFKNKKGSENLNRFSVHFFPKGKKGINDVSIATTIIFIFVGIGIIMPYVNAEFDTISPDIDTDNLGDELLTDEVATGADKVRVTDLISSIAKMFFWTFGDLPFWLDAIFLVLRVTLLFIILRNFTPLVGGGG